jgi:hypothetical protein
LKVNDKNRRVRIQDPDPDPLVRGTDPRIRIRNTVFSILLAVSNLNEGSGYGFGSLYLKNLAAERVVIHCLNTHATLFCSQHEFWSGPDYYGHKWELLQKVNT